MIDFNQIFHSQDFFNAVIFVVVCFIISLILTIIFKKKINIFVFLAYSTIAIIGYLAITKEEIQPVEKKEIKIQEEKIIVKEKPVIQEKIEKKQNPNIKIEMH